MQKFRWLFAAVATAVLVASCAKKEEAAPVEAAPAAAAPAAEAAAPAAAAPAADAAAAVKDEDASQSGGDKVRP
jgi:hypothetical protein